MSYQNDAMLARSEAKLLACLSKAFLRPTSQFAFEIHDGIFVSTINRFMDDSQDDDVAQAVRDLEIYRKSLKDMKVDCIRLQMEIEYNRLFVGPGKLLAPPYESFYRSRKSRNDRGTLRTEHERAVTAFYRRFGFTMPSQFVDLPDHIAIELDFLSQLAELEVAAHDRNDSDEVLHLMRAQELFREEHTQQWIHNFVQAVHDGARLPIYSALATIVQRTL